MIGAVAVNRAAGMNNILLAGVRGRGSAKVSGVWCSSDKGSHGHVCCPPDSRMGLAIRARTSLLQAMARPGSRLASRSLPRGMASTGPTQPVTSCTINFTQQTLPAPSRRATSGDYACARTFEQCNNLTRRLRTPTTSSATLVGVVRSINATAAVQRGRSLRIRS